MLTKTFPFNPVLQNMAFAGERLTLTFKKKSGTQDRTYDAVPSTIAHQLFYKQTASEALAYFANNIKKKFKVIKVK